MVAESVAPLRHLEPPEDLGIEPLALAPRRVVRHALGGKREAGSGGPSESSPGDLEIFIRAGSIWQTQVVQIVHRMWTGFWFTMAGRSCSVPAGHGVGRQRAETACHGQVGSTIVVGMTTRLLSRIWIQIVEFSPSSEENHPVRTATGSDGSRDPAKAGVPGHGVRRPRGLGMSRACPG